LEVAGLLVTVERDHDVALLWRERYPALVRLAYLIVGDAGLAEEITQDAFIRVWRSWGRIRKEEAAAAYARATVVNLARNSLRRRVLEARHRVARSDDVAEVPLERLDYLRAVRSLPARQRACVALRYYEDLSEQETARLLGISIGTVKSQTHKALRRLQELLGGDGNG
jgi:RNA polymerase sigma-70 factor (sigma-E family)